MAEVEGSSVLPIAKYKIGKSSPERVQLAGVVVEPFAFLLFRKSSQRTDLMVDLIVPLMVPSKAEWVPLWACAVETVGGGRVPKITQGGKVPVSKPPLTITQFPGVGVGVGEGGTVAVAVGVGEGVAPPGSA